MSTKHDFIGNKTSLDIIGIYLEMARSRFTQPEAVEFPWQWNSDDKKTRIVIEAASNRYEDSKDTRPGIFVDRSALVFPKAVIGDRAAHDLTSGSDLYYTIATGQIILDCVSKSKGESALIGDLVAQHLVMGADILLKAFNFREITPITLMPSQPWEKDETCYITRVSSEFSYDIAWATIPSAIKVKRLGIFLSTRSEAENFSFGDSALVSMGIVDTIE